MNAHSDNATAARLRDITKQLNELQHDLAKESQQESAVIARGAIESLPSFGARLNERRKDLGIDMLTLELQTGVSASTLKRLFKNPEQVKFGSVYAVAEALGVSLCAVV